MGELSAAAAWGTAGRRTDVAGGSVLVNGLSLYYEASGQAEMGPTVLFLHESGGSSDIWRAQLVGLARGVRCLALDLPGHGQSEGQGCSTIGEYQTAVLGFLDALAIRWPVVVVGACLGAAVAVELARQAPGRVSGLVLCGASPGGRAGAETLAAVKSGQAPAGYMTLLFGEHSCQKLVGERLRRWQQANPTARCADLLALGAYDLVGAFHAIDRPALLISGSDDPVATPLVAAEVAWGMPRAQVRIIKQAGCLSMLEQPSEFNRLVDHYLRQIQPAAPVHPEPQLGGYRRYH